MFQFADNFEEINEAVLENCRKNREEKMKKERKEAAKLKKQIRLHKTKEGFLISTHSFLNTDLIRNFCVEFSKILWYYLAGCGTVFKLLNLVC